MSTPSSSLEKSFRDAAGGVRVPVGLAGVETDPSQLDLLRDADGKLPGNVFQLIRQGKAKGPGRPAGAGNKRNAKLAALICERSGDPVLFMSDVYAMPLDQLVELLRAADNVDEQDALLYRLAENVERQVETLLAKGSYTAADRKMLDGLVDKLGDISKVLRGRPGQLASAALAIQLQAARATAEYVHGKQPVSVHVQGKADMVLLVPGLNAPLTETSGELAAAVGKYGVECIDVEGMRLIPNFDGDDDDAGDEE